MNEIWENVIREVFVDKPSIVVELLKYTKISEYDSYNQTLKIRILKNYIEKIIFSKLVYIKKIFEKISGKPVYQINLNNKIYKFEHSSKNKKNYNRDIINEDIIINDNSLTANKKNQNELKQKEEAEEKEEFFKKIQSSKTLNLLFYNNLLFTNKKIVISLKEYNYQENLSLAIKYGWLILPGLFYLTKFLIYKKRWKKTKTEIDELLKIRFKPINKETNYFLKYCLNYD